MIISYQHNKEKEQVYEIVEDFLGKLQNKYSNLISNLSGQWNPSKDKMNFSFNSKNNILVEGYITLINNEIVFYGKLPFGPLNCKYKNTVESKVKEELDKVFINNSSSQ